MFGFLINNVIEYGNYILIKFAISSKIKFFAFLEFVIIVLLFVN